MTGPFSGIGRSCRTVYRIGIVSRTASLTAVVNCGMPGPWASAQEDGEGTGEIIGHEHDLSTDSCTLRNQGEFV